MKLYGAFALGALVVHGVVGAQPSPAQDTSLRPLYDHHVHLLSLPGSRSRFGLAELPPELDSVVRAREENWNRAEGLEKVFAPSARFFTGFRWIEGASAIAKYLPDGYTGPYQYRPVTYRIDGTQAEISGFVAEKDATEDLFGYFHLQLRKSEPGVWQIQSESQVFPGPVVEAPVTAADQVKRLDEAGTKKAVVLSDAYYFSLTPKERPGEHERVRAENDWTATQVAQFPDRLIAFFSVNPLRSFALEEVDRCARSGKFKGLKLHLNAAQIKYQDPIDVRKARLVFERANHYRLPLVIHVRSSDEYGTADAQVLLKQLIAAAPDVTVQIAHLWGGESFAPEALAVYAEAVAAGDPVTKNLYFDISGAWIYGKPEHMKEMVARIRQIGGKRILWGSDGPPLQSWQLFRERVPLTEEEFRQIASNQAPYLK